MSKEVFSFVIYLINICANRWGMTTSDVYKKIKETDCIENYLVPFYDVLHTLGSAYMANDIRAYLEKRGITI